MAFFHILGRYNNNKICVPSYMKYITLITKKITPGSCFYIELTKSFLWYYSITHFISKITFLCWTFVSNWNKISWSDLNIQVGSNFTGWGLEFTGWGLKFTGCLPPIDEVTNRHTYKQTSYYFRVRIIMLYIWQYLPKLFLSYLM